MKKASSSATENLKENFYSAADKTTEMAKSFIETGTKQFEATMNAGKTLFDTLTKQYMGKDSANTGGFIKDGIESSVTAATQWLKESSKIMTDIYDKQVRFIFDSYSGFMKNVGDNISNTKSTEPGNDTFHASVSLFIKNMEASADVTKKMFAYIIDKLTRETDKSFTKELSVLMQDTYNRQAEQLLKFNKTLLDAANLQSTIKLNKEVSDKLEKDLEKNLEASKKIIKAIADSYTRETSFSAHTGKKMLDEIFAEIDIVTKNNMKFWTSWFDEVYGNTGTASRTKSKNSQSA